MAPLASGTRGVGGSVPCLAPPQRRGQVDAAYGVARAECLLMSDPELAGAENAAAHGLAACDDLDDPVAAEVCRLLHEPHHLAAADELAARERRLAAGTGPAPRSPWAEGWRALADEVRAVSYTHLTLPTKRIV